MIQAESVEAERFLKAYAARSGATREQLLNRRVVASCTCDHEECEGFQLLPEHCVLEWRGEKILIRGDESVDAIESEARIRLGYAAAFDEGVEAGRGLRPATNPYRRTL